MQHSLFNIQTRIFKEVWEVKVSQLINPKMGTKQIIDE